MNKSRERHTAKKHQTAAHSSGMMINGKRYHCCVRFVPELVVQKARELQLGRQFRSQVRLQLLLQMRIICCSVDLPRCIGRTSALRSPEYKGKNYARPLKRGHRVRCGSSANYSWISRAKKRGRSQGASDTLHFNLQDKRTSRRHCTTKKQIATFLLIAAFVLLSEASVIEIVHLGKRPGCIGNEQHAPLLFIAEFAHTSGALNELRKWPGRHGVHVERGLTCTAIRLSLLGRGHQKVKGLLSGPEPRKLLQLQLLLSMLTSCLSVDLPRPVGRTAAKLSLVSYVGFFLFDGCSYVLAGAAIDEPKTFSLALPSECHPAEVPLTGRNQTTAGRRCRANSATDDVKLCYPASRGLNVTAEWDAEVKTAFENNRFLAVKHGDNVLPCRSACVPAVDYVTRVLKGDWSLQNYRLHDVVVCTGKVQCGASTTSAQQFLGSNLQRLVQLTFGSCPTVFDLELFRLASLASWPRLGKMSALRCSSAGFHRKIGVGPTSAGDDVACFSCGCTVEHWTAGVHPLSVHRDNCAQHCRFVAEPLSSGNVPIRKGAIEASISKSAVTVLTVPSSVASSMSSAKPNAADCMSSLGVRPLTQRAARAVGAYHEAVVAAIACGSSLVKVLNATSRRTGGVQSSIGSAPPACDDELAKHESYRLGTFVDVWVYDHIVDARDLARNGFFYAGPGDRVQCAFCHGLLRNWELGDRVDAQHAQHFTYCRFVQGHDVNNVPIPFWPLVATQTVDMHATDTTDATGANLGIICTPPKYPEFAVEVRRLLTFATWPATHHLNPDSIAKAGFFYLGKEDAVKCFFCDGTVADWRTNCDPWVEHAQRFPSCSFLLQVKGHDFVQRHLIHGEPPASTSKSSLAVDPREIKARMDSIKVRVLLGMDYPLDLIRDVVQRRLATVGSDHETSEQLLDDVFRTHDEKQKASSNGQNAGRRTMPNSTEPVVVSRLMARGGNESDLQSMPTDVVRFPMVAVAASAPAAANTGGSLTPFNPSVASDQVPPLVSRPTPTVQPEEENRQLKTQLTCKICMDSLVGIVFLPCGHLVCCASCAPAMTTCPICRVGIRGTVRTIM